MGLELYFDIFGFIFYAIIFYLNFKFLSLNSLIKKVERHLKFINFYRSEKARKKYNQAFFTSVLNNLLYSSSMLVYEYSLGLVSKLWIGMRLLGFGTRLPPIVLRMPMNAF